VQLFDARTPYTTFPHSSAKIPTPFSVTFAQIDTCAILHCMNSLEPPDSFHVSSAEGWMGLGNLAEARAELDQISRKHQSHPEVLHTRWALLAAGENWPEALAVARLLLKKAPKLAAGWLHQAYALRRVPEGGLQAAWDGLFPALDKFPGNAFIPYNLACYACQMQRFDIARILLHRAVKSGGREEIRQIALHDSDLQPLWEEIRSL
jgi:hypothetical protein